MSNASPKVHWSLRSGKPLGAMELHFASIDNFLWSDLDSQLRIILNLSAISS
jgi:hypothetical protein